MNKWIDFDECFDSENGGALYILDNEGGELDYYAVGVLWLDAVGDEKPYAAFMTGYSRGETTYDGITVNDIYDAAEAFSGAVDGDIVYDLGEYDDMDEAMQAFLL